MKISKHILLIAYFFSSAISGEIVESESAAVECECEGDDPQVNLCDKPHGYQKCNVFKNQTCPDMFCDDLKRCFSVLACPKVPIPEPIPCDGCECMDKQAIICLDDPLGQCNKCQESHPLSICRVPVDSKCVDKFCIEDDRCYAVTACDCESTPTASPTAATPTASPTTDELPMNETTTASSTGPYSEAVVACLYGHNDETVSDISLEECKAKCSSSTDFQCNSLEYLNTPNKWNQKWCYLSKETRATQPLDYQEPCSGDYATAIYLEKKRATP